MLRNWNAEGYWAALAHSAMSTGMGPSRADKSVIQALVVEQGLPERLSLGKPLLFGLYKPILLVAAGFEPATKGL
jgi:hypothetical protein